MRNHNSNYAAVKAALINDGWMITHDPMRLRWDDTVLYVDFAAERPTTPPGTDRRIAVIAQDVTAHDDMENLQVALGRYILAHDVLEQEEPARVLYLAVPEEVWHGLVATQMSRLLIESEQIRLLIFSPQDAAIREWVPQADYAVA